MTQLSRFKLDRKTQDRIINNFLTSLAKLEEGKEVDSFLSDLLTRTERIMLAKRLAIALMLQSDKSYAEIKNLLKVSSSTIGSVNNSLQSGKGYRLVIKKFLQRKQKVKIIG